VSERGHGPLWYCAQITPNCSAHTRGHGNITSLTIYYVDLHIYIYKYGGASVYSVLVAIRARRSLVRVYARYVAHAVYIHL